MRKLKSDLATTRQFHRYSKTDNLVIRIPKNFCTRWQIDPTSAMIYKTIADSDLLEYGCYTGSKNDLATITFTGTSTVLRILQKLEERGFIAKVQIRTADGKNIIAYKNLGLDCNLPLHVGKPFSPVEKLELNLLQRKDILQAWKTEYSIETV